MANNRTFYAIKELAFKDNADPSGDLYSPSGWEVAHGVQTLSMTTTYNLEQIFEFGQLAIYENAEGIPDIEVTIEKVLDGTKPLYLMTTDENFVELVGRTADYRTDMLLQIYADTQSRASGTAVQQVTGSGMYLSAITYTYGVDGAFTESISLVGNNKVWGNLVGQPSGAFNTDEKATIIGSGVQFRENFDLAGSTLPSQIPTDDISKIQSITVSADLGREEIFALGQKDPFFRFVTFPIEITTAIEVVTAEGDLIDARADQDNLVDETIILLTDSGLSINLGTSNKLASTDFGGGDSGGGNDSITYNYSTQNDLTIEHVSFT